MAIRPWKRMREQASDADAARPDDSRINPWGEGEVPRLGDLGIARTETATEESSTEKAQQYAAWQRRMQEKRARTQAMVAGPQPSEATERAHWSTDALFAESRLVEEHETVSRPNPWRTRELLSTLDLTEGASFDDISLAYRRLAKTHHPDRFLDASDDVREFHAQKMLDINAAYRSLKALHATAT